MNMIEETVYVLLKQGNQYIETGSDAISTTSMNFVHVFKTEIAAQKYLDDNVREALHREYTIKECEVRG